MPLAGGSKLGPYEILALLGAGGMGEVYRARDPRLGREIAIKVLAPALAGDPQQLARFTREARALASLNHPHIETIHGLEHDGGIDFLVLELLAGEPLASRIANGPLPWPEAVRIAIQVADALEAAHARGLVHRDLKPQNIALDPAGRVKLLDFGLARPTVPGGESSQSDTSPLGITASGSLLGTPAYMSPEQARGTAVDERTDVWALGCVLFEMLGGRAPFARGNLADTLSAVISVEPDWAALPADTPPRLVALLRGCLEKDRERRALPAADVEAALIELAADAAGAAPPALLFQLKQVTFEDGVQQFPCWSPDGAELVYAAPEGGVRKLFRRRPGADPVALTRGPSDDLLPQWSPDGKTVYFVRARTPGRQLEPADVFGHYVDGDVWAVDVATGEERRLVEQAFNPAPSPDGRRLAVDASWAGPRRIWILDRNGRNPVQVSGDESEAVVHARPRWAPDGGRLVFQVIERTRFDLGALDLARHEMRRLLADGYQNYQPAWSPRGDAIWFASYRSGGLNLWRLSVDPRGTPTGPPRQVTTGAGQDVEPAPAPDGRNVAFTTLRQNASLYRLPVDPLTGHRTGAPERVVASTREDSRGAWSPDGARIAFNSDRDGAMNIWIREADARLVQVTRGAGGDYQPNWSPDQSRIAFFSSRGGHPAIWAVELASGQLVPLSPAAQPGAARAIEINPFHSPDGRHIAYQSDADGRLEVWVMEADGTHARPLTDVGVMGHFLCWSADGRFVVFRRAGAEKMTMRVPVDGGAPEPLPPVTGGSHMSFSPDRARIMDVVDHKTLWVSPLGSPGAPEPVFTFDDPDVRIDYPVWSPDGRYVLFDRFRPQGGDIWLLSETA